MKGELLEYKVTGPEVVPTRAARWSKRACAGIQRWVTAHATFRLPTSPKLPWRRSVIALAVVALAYLVVFAATRTTHPGWLAVLVFGNTASLALAAAAVRVPLIRWTPRLEGAALWAGHGVLAAAFSWGWLWLLTLLAGLMGGDGPMRFQVSPLLLGPAQTWQLLQGIAVYAALAAWTALEIRPPAVGLVVVDDRAGLNPEPCFCATARARSRFPPATSSPSRARTIMPRS